MRPSVKFAHNYSKGDMTTVTVLKGYKLEEVLTASKSFSSWLQKPKCIQDIHRLSL